MGCSNKQQCKQEKQRLWINKKFATSYVFHVLVEKAPEDVVKEEDDQTNAGNLLDNLFRKTKTTPCLYWLPLSDEQVSVVIFFFFVVLAAPQIRLAWSISPVHANATLKARLHDRKIRYVRTRQERGQDLAFLSVFTMLIVCFWDGNVSVCVCVFIFLFVCFCFCFFRFGPCRRLWPQRKKGPVYEHPYMKNSQRIVKSLDFASTTQMGTRASSYLGVWASPATLPFI